jgi:hypothetical protein
MRQYEISRSSYRCNDCQRELAAQEEFVAAVRTDEQEDDLLRQDYCLACWARRSQTQQPSNDAAAQTDSSSGPPSQPAGPARDADVLGVWHTRVPPTTARKKLFVDDELLINFFNRLESADSESMLHFRFVLALVLMRKKLLVYDRLEREEGQEYWVMHLRGDQARARVLDPRLDEQKIAQVSRHLGQILEGEL